MRFSSDRTGFPLIEIDEIGLAVTLLPVTKVQFELFLSEQNDFGDLWYEKALQLNPRISWRHIVSGEQHKLWLTGIRPEEAVLFSSWLGGFDLPTAQQWLDFDSFLMPLKLDDCFKRHVSHLDKESLDSDETGGGDINSAALGMLHPAAQSILTALLNSQKPETWGHLTLLQNGLMEWVRWSGTTLSRNASGFGALGRPPKANRQPQDRGPHCYRPTEARNGLRGFRPVRPL